jgi:serine protease Do
MEQRLSMRIVLKLADVTRLMPRALLTLGLVVAALSLSPQMARAGAGESFAPLVENLLPAVVNISTVQNAKDLRAQADPQQQVLPPMPFPPGSPFEELFRNFFDQQQQRQQRPVNSLGSGFIIDPSGIVVTNNHVIADADVINVTLQDNTSLKAEIIGRDKKVDLAVLKVKSDKPLPFVRWGNSDTARVGDWILAIGNPFGLGGTVTTGIVSARARDIDCAMTILSKPMPRSIAAIRAGPCLTCRAKWSGSTARFLTLRRQRGDRLCDAIRPGQARG